LNFLAGKTELLKPENVLKKGYSISYVDRNVLRSVQQATPGGRLITRVADGEIKSKIE